HALVLHRADEVVYDVACFTNLTQDHLDFHGTMEEYYRAKRLLFTPEHARRGVVCVDDGWGRRLAQEARIPVTTYTTRAEVEADHRAGPHRPDGYGSLFEVEGPDGTRTLQAALPGRHYVANTLAADLLLAAIGHTGAAVTEALGRAGAVPGRVEAGALASPAARASSGSWGPAATATGAGGRAGGRARHAWPTWSSSRTTTPAPRTRRRSAARCSPASRRARKRRSTTWMDEERRSRWPPISRTCPTPSSSRARVPRPGSRSAVSSSRSMTGSDCGMHCGMRTRRAGARTTWTKDAEHAPDHGTRDRRPHRRRSRGRRDR